jgi:hypothetical protein
MKRYRGDPPDEKERQRTKVRQGQKSATPGTYTGHEANVGATARAIKRNKRSL